MLKSFVAGKNDVKYVKSNNTVKRIRCVFEMDWMFGWLTMMMAETKNVNIHSDCIRASNGPNSFFWLYKSSNVIWFALLESIYGPFFQFYLNKMKRSDLIRSNFIGNG